MSGAVVVKLGSGLVVGRDGRPRRELLGEVAADLAPLVAAAQAVAVVSSGAIALGTAAGAAGRRSRSLARLQAASALGQAELQRVWHDAFSPLGLRVAQVLLTGAELAERRAYLNVRNALGALFELGAVPILNENDATSTDEIGFGDNDILAAQVAMLLRAARLILLTSVDGVLSHPPGVPGAATVPDGADLGSAVLGVPSSTGTGGIQSKIRAAQLAAAGGVEAVIASPSSLRRLLGGEAAGTRFAPSASPEPAFKLWLRHGKPAVSRLLVDEGAANALLGSGRSLLAVGVESWTGDFRAGDGVDVCFPQDVVIARGISAVDATEIGGRPVDVEVIHRDKLVLL